MSGRFSKLEAGAPERILIVKMSSLGDIILSLPMLRSIRRRFPGAEIGWVVESPFRDVLLGNSDLDRLFVIDTGSLRSRLASVRRVLREIRSRRFDVVIDTQGWIKSQSICLLSGARSMIGLKKRNELGFHMIRNGIELRGDAHMADLFLDVAGLLGADERTRSFEIPISEGDRAYVDRALAAAGWKPDCRVAVLQPGSSWESKRWDPGKFAEVGRALSRELDLRVVVARGPGEESLARAVARELGTQGIASPPTSIGQLAALLERSQLYVGTDSGPMHLAAALDVPIVALFGPSDPGKFGPWARRAEVVQGNLACRPCLDRHCRFGTTECMTSLSVGEVLEAAHRVCPKGPADSLDSGA
jgi:heptosyltransferase-1